MDGVFRLRFEHVADDGATTRSEHVYGARMFIESLNADGILADKVKTLHAKVIGSMKEDGIIPPPSNVVHVDFKRKKRA